MQRFRYVQVSTSYDQTGDVPPDRVASLPQNAFGARMEAKRATIFDCVGCADQVGVAAVAFPEFATTVARMSQNGAEPTDAGDAPTLGDDANGHVWLVQQANPRTNLGSSLGATASPDSVSAAIDTNIGSSR